MNADQADAQDENSSGPKNQRSSASQILYLNFALGARN